MKHESPETNPGTSQAVAAESSISPMTAAERNALQSLAKMNARVAKADVDAVVSARWCEFENELARDWSSDELKVTELVAEANERIKAINAEIDRQCDELGVRSELRPRLISYLHSSPRLAGERQIEIRRKARAELDAAGKRAKVEIDRQTAAVCADIIRTGLTSVEASEMLGRVASPESLVPTLAVRELEASVRGGAR